MFAAASAFWFVLDATKIKEAKMENMLCVASIVG